MSGYAEDTIGDAGVEGDLPEERILDEELVEKIKAEALIQAGYSVTTEDGAVRSDVRQLQVAVFEGMRDRHIVSGKGDLSTRSATSFELYQEVLPDGPGVRSLARTDEEHAVQSQLTKLVWGYANVGINSFVQKHVADRGLVLCEAKVARTKINEETHKRQPTTELARFLTLDGELIMTYYTGPAGAAFLRAARKLDAQLGLVADRRPELSVPVAKQLHTVVRQAVASIPHADTRSVTALTSGSPDGDGA